MTVISQLWDDSIVPTLVEYIRIPAKSPHFDRDWQSHGYIDEAARLAAQWCERNAIAGMKLEIVRLEGRTPCLFIDVPGTASSNGIQPRSRRSLGRSMPERFPCGQETPSPSRCRSHHPTWSANPLDA